MRLHQLAAALVLSIAGIAVAQEPTDQPAIQKRWAVILVGLPGDAEHEESFGKAADQLQSWLTDSLQYPVDQIVRLPAAPKNGESIEPTTAASIQASLADLNRKLKPEDSLWVFVLGHGNYDGKRAWLHVKGKDPSNEDFGRWLEEVKCREQVIWVTQSSSGWFVKPLSRAGRIVIAATAADDESNETEFPHALLTVARWPLEKLDLDQDKLVSVAELYTATIGEVVKRFQTDKRLPTEHPQLDDNGDGIGTEEILPKKQADPDAPTPPPNAKRDGDLAKRTIVPYRVAEPTKTN